MPQFPRISDEIKIVLSPRTTITLGSEENDYKGVQEGLRGLVVDLVVL